MECREYIKESVRSCRAPNCSTNRQTDAKLLQWPVVMLF